MFKHMTKKQKKMLKRILLAALLTIPCLFIPDNDEMLFTVLRAAAFAVPYTVAGYDIVIKAFKNIKGGQIFDENLLMGVATIGAYGLGDFFEAVMVVLLYQIGELFQSLAVASSRRSISELMDIRPDYANLAAADGSYKQVAPESVKIGDTILIKSGEKIPLDCTILSGTSEIDTSSLTGESVPRAVGVGDPLSSGCVNISGTLTAKVEKVFGESTVSKILEMTENKVCQILHADRLCAGALHGRYSDACHARRFPRTLKKRTHLLGCLLPLRACHFGTAFLLLRYRLCLQKRHSRQRLELHGAAFQNRYADF